MSKSVGLAGMKKHWLGLSKTATWLLLVFSPFLVRPPWGLVDLEGSAVGYKVTHFALSVLVGLSGLAIAKIWADKPMGLWLSTSVIALVLGLAAWAVYIYCVGVWSLPYAGHWVVGGSELTEAAKHQIALGHRSDLVEWFTGDVRKVWSDPDTMQRRWLVLVGLHGLASLLLATAIVTYFQARAAAKKKPRKGQPKDQT